MIGVRCVLCTRRPPRQTEGRRRACEQCGDGLYRQLANISELTQFLRVLLPPGRIITSQPIGRPGDASPAPLRVDVLALLTDTGDLSVAGVLGDWACRVATARRMTLTRDDPAAFLRRHVDWITEQPYLEELAADVTRIETAVARVCREETYRAAVCRRVIDDHECGGAIIATAESDTATCDRCGTVWQRDRWREMGATA